MFKISDLFGKHKQKNTSSNGNTTGKFEIKKIISHIAGESLHYTPQSVLKTVHVVVCFAIGWKANDITTTIRVSSTDPVTVIIKRCRGIIERKKLMDQMSALSYVQFHLYHWASGIYINENLRVEHIYELLPVRRFQRRMAKPLRLCLKIRKWKKRMVIIHFDTCITAKSITSTIMVYPECNILDLVKICARTVKHKKLMDQNSDFNHVTFGLTEFGQNYFLPHDITVNQISSNKWPYNEIRLYFKKRNELLLSFKGNKFCHGFESDGLLDRDHLYRRLLVYLPDFPSILVSKIVQHCTICEWDGESKITSLESLVGLYIELDDTYPYGNVGFVKDIFCPLRYGVKQVVVSFKDGTSILKLDKVYKSRLLNRKKLPQIDWEIKKAMAPKPPTLAKT